MSKHQFSWFNFYKAVEEWSNSETCRKLLFYKFKFKRLLSYMDTHSKYEPSVLLLWYSSNLNYYC